MDFCGCHASKQSDSPDQGLVSSMPISYRAISLLYVDFIHGLPKFGGYDSCLVVTCGLTRFIRAFPCNKKITGEQTVKIWLNNGLNTMGHLRRCTLRRKYVLGVTRDGTSKYRTAYTSMSPQVCPTLSLLTLCARDRTMCWSRT